MSSAFRGPLAVRFDEFTTLMQATGGRHLPLLSTLGRLDRFLATSYPEATTLTKTILAAWFASFDQLRPSSRMRYRSATFQVCKFLRGRDPATASIKDFEPLRCSHSFRPYIFSREEITRLLAAARALPARSADPMRPWSSELVITLLCTAGLRIGEVVRLQVRDYDAADATLVVRETKFAKTRLVPVSASAKRIVDEYLARRRRLGLSCLPLDPLRCCPSNHPPCLGAVQVALVRLMRGAGLKPPRGRGPRIHDIRHTFAVERVHQWYREGKDVQALLPRLVTYLGHRNLESTQRYLSLTPAVLHEASARFERFADKFSHGREVKP